MRDTQLQRLTANDHGTRREAEINITGLAGFLLAKAAAAYGRRKPKDWYDIAFVLLHNDHGDPVAAATRVREIFGLPTASIRTHLQDLKANFDGPSAQGTSAYVEQLSLDHPEIDPAVAAADGQLAVGAFADRFLEPAA